MVAGWLAGWLAGLKTMACDIVLLAGQLAVRTMAGGIVLLAGSVAVKTTIVGGMVLPVGSSAGWLAGWPAL